MRTLLFCAVVLLCGVDASAQDRRLSYREASTYHVFEVNDRRVSLQEFRNILAANPVALEKFNAGRSLKTAGTVIGCAGAFVFGWELGRMAGGAKGDNAVMIGGAIGFAVVVIMSKAGDRGMEKGISLFNGDRSEVDVRFGFTTTGAGLSMRF